MQANERILHSNSYIMLCQEDDNKTQWNIKRIVVTQYSFMAFNHLSKLFDYCEAKILFYQHDCFYVRRSEFIQYSEMVEKEQVGCLHKDYQFIVILVDKKVNSFNLIGCKDEKKSRELTKAIQLANRYQEMCLISDKFKMEIMRDYLNFMVQSCNCDLKFFEIKKEMLDSKKQFMILKHFVARSDLIEHISFKGFKMTIEEIDIITSLIVILPQNQIKSLRFINCNLTDNTLPLLGRAIKHNGFLDYLDFEKVDITDKSLRFFSGLWQYIPFLNFFALTKCENIKGEIYFSSFLEKITCDLQLKVLNLSHNSLTANILDHLVEELFTIRNLTLDVVDLSFNKITPRENWKIYQIYNCSDMKKTCILELKPYPINLEMYNSFNEQITSLDIKLSRMNIKPEGSKFMLNKNEISRVKELKEELQLAILYKRSIESIYKLCKKINKLKFDFPPQYLESTTHFLRESMTTAEETRDYYSYYYAKEAGKMLLMNQRDIQPKAVSIKNKADSFAQSLSRLFNFQIPETQANIIFDELVEKAIKRNYRGPAIDLLFYLKYKRDQTTNQLLKKRVDGSKIELELMQKDPFFMLHYNEDFADKTRDVQAYFNRSHDYLGIHLRWVPYEMVSSLTKTQLLNIVSSVSRMEHVNMTEIPTNQLRRCKFLLGEFATPEYMECKTDFLLKIARTVCVYRYKKGESELEFKKIYVQVKNFVEEEMKEGSIAPSGVTSREINSKSQTGLEEGSVLPSAKLSRRDSIKSFTGKRNIKDANEEIGAVIDFMTVNKPKKNDGARTPQPQTTTQGMSWSQRKRSVHESGSETDKTKSNNTERLIPGSTNSRKSNFRPKLPFSYDVHDVSTGLKVNSYIIKICRLDFFRQRTSFIKILKEFISLGRGEKRVDFRYLLINESHIIGEMFLGTIRFINNYIGSISPKLISNGINLLCFLSYYFKLPRELAVYTLRKFYELNYMVIRSRKDLHGVEKIIKQAETFMSNILDKLQTGKFWIGKGFQLPQDVTITEIFQGGDSFINFRLLIVAKKIKIEQIKCKETQFVFHFVKEIQEIEYLFEGLELNPDAYWLFIECEESHIPDIPCNWDWTMKRVKHLLEWMRSYNKGDKFQLTFKRRVYSIRYRSGIARFTQPKINTIFYEVKRLYLVKNCFQKYVKLDKIVEISYVLGLIEDLENNVKGVHLRSGSIYLQKTIPEKSLFLLSESEWLRRREIFMEKNAHLKNHTLFSLKKKFLNYLIDSPCFCASIYKYGLAEEKDSEVKRDGTLSINIYGIYFFEGDNFELPTFHYRLEEIRYLEVLEDYVTLEFLVEANEKQLHFTTKLISINKEDIAYDIISYMLIAMREPKKLYYAYNYLGKHLQKTSKMASRSQYNKSSEPVIFKCNEEIAKLRNIEIDLRELAYTKEYNLGIEKQANTQKWSMYTETVQEKELKQQKLLENKNRRQSTIQSVNTQGIMKKNRRSSKSWGYGRMSSIRIGQDIGMRRSNQIGALGGLQDKSYHPTPTQAALEFLNSSMYHGNSSSGRNRPPISPHLRAAPGKIGDTYNTDPMRVPPGRMKQNLLKQQLIEEEEHKDQFEGYNDSEIFGGASYISKGSSRNSKTNSQFSSSEQSRRSLSLSKPKSISPVPRLNIGSHRSNNRGSSQKRNR